MTTFFAVAAAIILLLGTVAAFRRAHPRTTHLPQAPFGLGREGDRDLSRARADLLAVRAHTLRCG